MEEPKKKGKKKKAKSGVPKKKSKVAQEGKGSSVAVSPQPVSPLSPQTPSEQSQSPQLPQPVGSPVAENKEKVVAKKSEPEPVEEESEPAALIAKEGEGAIEDWELEAKYENKRKIPRAKFFEDVAQETSNDVEKADKLLVQLQTLKWKYTVMDNTLSEQKRNYLEKIPDMEAALASIDYLISKKEAEDDITCRFMLSDAVYACAQIPTKNTIFLWLGANVMLEYEYEEAKKLLTTNLQNAQTNLKNLQTDLNFLKDQITITEVNIARVHNHRFELRKLARIASGEEKVPSS